MKSLIIGASGLVGSALARQLPDSYKSSHVPTKGRLYLDMLKYETIEKVISGIKPNIVYLPAANTNVDLCEDLETDAINIKGITNVIRVCEKYKVKLVFFSSSYVFDGEAEHPYDVVVLPNPINNYGKQKYTVENLISKSTLSDYLIIRTIGVFGPEVHKKNFATQVISRVFKGKEIFVPNDQWMNPIHSDDLSRIVVKLAEHHNGLFHVAGDTCISKYEWAVKIADEFGLSGNVKSKTSEEMKQKSKRPSMGCLDSYELENLGIKVPSLDMGLVNFLSQEFV
jgi:dTDP-4-dehydrorhamnose reductase